MESIAPEEAGLRAASLLKGLREERGISQLQLAHESRLAPSIVSRAERGKNCRLETWARLFDGLGYLLKLEVQELCEEAADLLSEEAERRKERRREGLCTGKRRLW